MNTPVDVHLNHVRLGYRCGNCELCYPAGPRPQHHDLPALRAERDPQIVTEAELRLLDGNR